MGDVLSSEGAEHLDVPAVLTPVVSVLTLWLISDYQSKVAGRGLGKGCPHSRQPVGAGSRSPLRVCIPEQGFPAGPRGGVR